MNQDMCRDFGVLLSQLAEGTLRDEVNREMAQVMKTLLEHAKTSNGKAKGKVTLSLDFAVMPNGMTSIEGDVTTKTPRPIRDVDHLYIDEKGGFCRQDPRQLQIRGKIQEVKPRFDVETGEVREPEEKEIQG